MPADREPATHKSAGISDVLVAGWMISRSAVLGLVTQVSHHDLAEDFARVDVLQPDVRIDCSVDTSVPQKLLDQHVLAWALPENEGTGCVPKLMHGHAHAGRVVDPVA